DTASHLVACYTRTSLFHSYLIPPPASSYSLSLHDALPIYCVSISKSIWGASGTFNRNNLISSIFATGRLMYFHQGKSGPPPYCRSEEHTSELQSRFDLVCRLLLEKKKYIR